jgi:homocysteine S-methyltransferase
MANRFLDRLRSGPPIVADGGLGVLLSSAVPRLRFPEEANLRAPQSVVSLHLSFIHAGAELIETNSFGANRRKLRALYLEDEVRAINEAAVKLAREARQVSGREVFIAGAIGPLGDVGDAEDDRAAVFAEQAQCLAGRGVDLFSVETFFDLDELVTAIEAVRSVAKLPILAMLTFDEEAETIAGVGAGEAAARLAGLGVDAIGTNHGAGPHAALAALAAMDASELPLAAMPNIGLASMAGGKVIYPHATNDYFVEFAAQARSLGARIIGGCCGTTPAQIEAIRAAVQDERAPTAPFVAAERALAVQQARSDVETQLARDLREGTWVVSIQLDPPFGSNPTGLIDVSRAAKESGRASYVDINDNATARVGMSSLMVAASIERTVGIETIPHLTPRDTTVMGLESLLLGAHAEGIRNILAVTGDPPEVGDYPGSRAVYEVDAIGLTQLITRLNNGEDYHGRTIDAPTSFFVGVALNPNADDVELEIERYRRKLDAGAQFAMTQIVYETEQLDRFLDKLGGSPIPLLVGVFPLTSHRLALRLHNEVPGIVVPDALQEELRDAGPDAEQVGLERARELIDAVRDQAAGVYVVAPYKRPLAALELL